MNINDKFGDGITKEREDQFDIMLHHINWHSSKSKTFMKVLSDPTLYIL